MLTERPTEQSLTLQSPVGTREPLVLGKSLTVPMQSETDASCLCVCACTRADSWCLFQHSLPFIEKDAYLQRIHSAKLGGQWSRDPRFPHLYVLALTAMPDLHGCWGSLSYLPALQMCVVPFHRLASWAIA